MNHELSISDYCEFRQIVVERPHLLTHCSVLLCFLLVTGAVVFASVTKANLVVRASGRMRSATEPVQIYSGEVFNSATGARVIDVSVKKGDIVNKGDVLIRLDTRTIDNEISKLKRMITTEKHGLAQLYELRNLVIEEFNTAAVKAKAELDQALVAVEQDQQRRKSEIRLAKLSLNRARDELARLDEIARKNVNAISKQQHYQAQIKVQETSAKLVLEELPVDDSRLEVLELAVTMLQRSHKAALAEFDIRSAARQGAIDAAQLDLNKLGHAREQSVIRSTLTGVVTSDVPQVGDVIRAGSPVVELAKEDGFQFHVTVPNEQVGDLKTGMHVRIKLDAFDYRQYGSIPGKVVFIAPDSEPIHSPSGPASTYYLVKIEPAQTFVGHGDRRAAIKLGLTGNVDIVTGRELLASLLIQNIEKSISL